MDMSQTIVYLLLALALFLPLIGALVLRVFGPRLNATQFYGSAAAMFAMTLLSVFMLARSDLPSLQLGQLSILLPVTSPGDVAVELPPEPPPEQPAEPDSGAVAGGATASAPTSGAVASEATASTPTDAPSAAATAFATEAATAAPTDEPTAAPTDVPTATPAPTEAPTAAPEPTAPRKYTVQPGDTLRSIAEQFNVSVKSIIDANQLSDAEADSLRVGQELVIPE
jgi:LysM repeat protein